MYIQYGVSRGWIFWVLFVSILAVFCEYFWTFHSKYPWNTSKEYTENRPHSYSTTWEFFVWWNLSSAGRDIAGYNHPWPAAIWFCRAKWFPRFSLQWNPAWLGNSEIADEGMKDRIIVLEKLPYLEVRKVVQKGKSETKIWLEIFPDTIPSSLSSFKANFSILDSLNGWFGM